MAKATICVLLFLGYIWLSEFLASSQGISGRDLHDVEVKLRSDVLKNYSIDVLPPHNSTSPIVVKLGLQIISIKELDAKTQTLSTESWLKMTWIDTRLTWDPIDYAGINVLHLAPHKVWQPDIQLYNSAKMGEMDVKTEVFVLLYKNGDVLWIPPVSLHSLCDVDLKYYPYDRHTCKYKFGSWTHDGEHVDIEAYEQSREQSMDLSDAWNTGGEWEIVGSSILKSSTKYPCCSENYPDVTHSVTLQRRSPFYRIAILCPLAAAALLTLASFWIPPTSCHRITLNIVCFLTMIALLMHLSSKLPAVGNNCPLIMIFCGILLLTSALTTVISIAFLIIARSKTNEQTPHWIRRIAQSPIMKLFCITTPMHGNVQGSELDYSVNLVSEEDTKTSRGLEISKPNIWLMFFQLIDRLLFIFILIIIIIVMAAASA